MATVSVVVPHPKKDLSVGDARSIAKRVGWDQGAAMHYVTIIDKEPGSTFGIRSPEMMGCFSAADTFDDIIAYAIEALCLFFENYEPVPVLGIKAVREQVA